MIKQHPRSILAVRYPLHSTLILSSIVILHLTQKPDLSETEAKVKIPEPHPQRHLPLLGAWP